MQNVTGQTLEDERARTAAQGAAHATEDAPPQAPAATPEAPPDSASSPSSFLEALLEEHVQREAAAPLDRLLGRTLPKDAEGRHTITACGRFHGSSTVDLLGHLQTKRASGALVVVEQDAERVLYLRDGALVGSDSTVLFERLGRLLYQADVVPHDGSTTLADAEEFQGAQALLLWLPSKHLAWAVERRVWEVAAALQFIKRGHFAFVEGAPALRCPPIDLEPTAVAREGERRHEQFRRGTTPTDGVYTPPTMPAPPAPITRKLQPIEMGAETLEAVLQRIREAEADGGADD